MLEKDILKVYAQYHEDIIIASLLPNVKKGFYVDVGANHETYHSVTKFFYDRGWSGINIEPNKHLFQEIAKVRKRDINICSAVSDHSGMMDFREYPKHDGFSTLSNESKTELESSGIPFIDYKVPVITLEDIFANNKVKSIDFIKIDVEGYEPHVIDGNDWEKYHPTVVCVEANHKKESWSNKLIKAGYQLVIFDGLNEYYLSKNSIDNFNGFADRATLMAHNSLREHHIESFTSRVSELKKIIDGQNVIIKRLTEDSYLSLRNKSYPIRLKIAVKGLTVNYFRYKKGINKTRENPCEKTS